MHETGATVQLSNSECCTLTRRVLSALGIPPGADIEIGNALVWLAATDTVPLKFLVDLLPELQREPETQCLNILSLIETLDRLAAFAGSLDKASSARVKKSKAIALLLPLALARSNLNLCFRLQLPKSRIIIENGEIWSAEKTLWIRNWHHSNEVLVVCVSNQLASDLSLFNKTGLNWHFSQSKLQSLSSRRINIDFESLQILKRKAAESFVPNSDLSRRSGAGAEVDDND